MTLDLIVLIPEAAADYEQALSIYHAEREVGEPSTPALQSFAEQLSARFGDDDWPFTADHLYFPDHVSLQVAPERWAEVVPGIVALAHAQELVILDPQYEQLFPPGTTYQ
jgi:hypothetical protein